MASLRIENVTFDCVDPAPLARWWAEQTGGEVHALMPGEFLVVDCGEGPRLAFQRVPDPTPGKNRIHLDFHTDDPEGAVARLTAAGASEVARHAIEDFRWIVLTDPDGNAFCISG
ncbi:VOC family protein [Mycolicibacterium thermoresistibile]|jgi:predicted enzyme related to lactoylglutathione lyase|uniref:VOC domain-containing protein n=2 Tax=Mycolicibacterium thermoresistibile TaxID=1797 RepID=G7CGM0_MYCT3|nr:VOC family protein [Mycolicibacterium thermoresistibile]EHI11980.1 hypothetical protein KEK_13813 [Mycolicibacterium thermoresistibile ATCC 19527]MCV7188943.1 VOC family protein [Mycolicibacterium thermoresistibile]GAT14872.1 glyoxalase/bleomycin resistance protein/dioxygenase [Mycolicibacterium thermoresistibile]SNW20095.1 glyoxalase [Mycolicibacterium thermoresistibile]